MKHFILAATVISMLAAGSMANAADCKYKQNQVDLFSKEVLVKTEWVDMTSWISATFNRTIGNRQDLEVAAAEEGGQSFLKLRVKASDTTRKPPTERDLYHALYVPQGARLEITLADQTTFELLTDKEARGTTRAKYDEGTFVISTKFNVQYPLDVGAAGLLADQNVTYIRMAARDGKFEFVPDRGTIDFEVNEKGQKAVKKVIGCLQQAQQSEAS